MAKAKTATPQSKVSKKDAKVKQAAVKAETKKKIVKEESSSSEEESSSDEDDAPAKVNGAATPAASKAAIVTPAEEDTSSEEESSSDEETATPAKAAEVSSSDEESSDEEDAPVAAAAVESSEEESSSDEEEAPAKAVAAKAESSEEESSSGEEESSDDEAAVPATKAAAKKDSSSEEESSDDDSDEEMTETANAAETVKTNKRKAADISKTVNAAKPLADTVSSSSGGEESSEEEEQPVKKSKKNDGKAEPKAAEKSDVDASAAQGSRTIFCKNLPWATSDEDLAGFFADCGEVTECRIAMDRDTGKAKGFAHIQFESVEAAAKAIGQSGQNFGGRDIFIDTAQERTGGGGGGAGGAGFERPQRNQFSDTEGTTIFVKGFDKYLGEDAIREQLTAAFAECGEIGSVRLPSDRESGELKGIGFIEFATTEAKNKAGEYDGTEAAGGYLKVDLNPGSGGGRGGGRGGDRGGRGFGGGRGGGRGFGGGRGRDGGRGGRGGGFRGGRGGDRGGRGGGRGRGDFKPKMRIDAGTASGSKVTFD